MTTVEVGTELTATEELAEGRSLLITEGAIKTLGDCALVRAQAVLGNHASKMFAAGYATAIHDMTESGTFIEVERVT
jgi:hypothetical protein